MSNHFETAFAHVPDARLREMAEVHLERYRQLIADRDVDLAIPMLLIEAGDGGRSPDGSDLSDGDVVPVSLGCDLDGDQGEMVFAGLATLIIQMRAKRAVWGSEAWMVTTDKDKLDGVQPRDHPDRVDILNIVAMDAASIHGRTFPVLNIDDGRLVGQPSELSGDSEAQWGGRMAGWLRPALALVAVMKDNES